MKTFKVLGLLMSYPEPEWVAHLDECEAHFLTGGISAEQTTPGCAGFHRGIESQPICTVLQEEYVFDFRPRPFTLACICLSTSMANPVTAGRQW